MNRQWKSSTFPVLLLFFKLDLRLVFHMVDRNIFLDRMEDWIGFPDAELHWICESFLFNRIYILPKKKQRSNAKYITGKKGFLNVFLRDDTTQLWPAIHLYSMELKLRSCALHIWKICKSERSFNNVECFCRALSSKFA